MRGIVTTAMNERQKPGVNTLVTKFYENGDVVEIVDSVFGDEIGGEDRWYKLNTGNFLWSGGVEVNADCSFLPFDQRDHYLISYRQIDERNGKPNLETKIPPKILYSTPVRLPAETESIRTDKLVPAFFVEALMQAVRKLSIQRKHVFVYIHGYQLFSSLKLDIFSSFVMNYMTHPQNSIAKVLFFAWPGQGGPSRETVDDRSVRAGQQFTENNLWETFQLLSKRLAAEDKTLNLVVHSFGNQLLNGMLNPDSADPINPDQISEKIPKGIFENIFLMAPDVTHFTVQHGGKEIENIYKDDNGKDFRYKFSGLKILGKNVYVFHDKYDYLLYASTRKFVGKSKLSSELSYTERLKNTFDYLNLGNYGSAGIEKLGTLEPGFYFEDVEKLISEGEGGDVLDYPFRGLKLSTQCMIDNIRMGSDYDKVNTARLIFNSSRFPEHHRYLYTCKPVVDRVLMLLAQGHP